MSSSSQSPESWISAFCALVGHEYFAEVSEDFIEDDFNLTGLQSQVPMYKEALEMILDVEPEDASDDEEEEDEEEEDEDDDEMQDGVSGGYRRDAAAERRHLRMASDLSVIESSAEMLYGLIHQRFITSRSGIQQMAEKYEIGNFGYCPRVHCHGAKVLPVGCSDIPGQETVKLFCPSCLDVYTPPNSRFQTVDGAFFGTTFGCLFFMTFPEIDVGGVLRPSQTSDPSNHPIASSSSAAQQNGGSGANGLTNSSNNRSLSSSLTSQTHHQTPNSHGAIPTSSSNAPLQPQPEVINGISPRNLAPGLGQGNVYEARIYGFRVSEFAKTGPRMKWLRSRPLDVNELDECAQWAQSQEEGGGHSAGMILTEDEAAIGDSEMRDQGDEIIGGEEDMGPDDGSGDLVLEHEGRGAVRSDSYPQKGAGKSGRRRAETAPQPQFAEGLANGDGGGGGTAVRVGNGG